MVPTSDSIKVFSFFIFFFMFQFCSCRNSNRCDFECYVPNNFWPCICRMNQASLASSIYFVRMHSNQKCICCRKKSFSLYIVIRVFVANLHALSSFRNEWWWTMNAKYLSVVYCILYFFFVMLFLLHLNSTDLPVTTVVIIIANSFLSRDFCEMFLFVAMLFGYFYHSDIFKRFRTERNKTEKKT